MAKKKKDDKKDLPVITEDQVDESLVEDAYNKIHEIVSENMANAVSETGEYLIKEFYGNKIENARSNKPVKDKSLNQLIEKMNDQSVKRSWIYNAVKLVVQADDYSDVQAYGQISHSQRVLLLPVKDRQTKEMLIDETVENKYTARQLKIRIDELKNSRNRTVKQVALNPGTLFSDEFKNELRLDHLKKMSPKDLEKLEVKVQTKIDNIEEMLKTHKTYLDNYKKLSEKIEKAKGESEAA